MRLQHKFLGYLGLFLGAAALGACGPAAERAAGGETVETVRTWREPIKRYDRRARRHVSLEIDYGDGAVTEHSPTARRLGGARLALRPPGPSTAELDAALTAAASDPAVRALLARRGAELAGGYPIFGRDGLAARGARPGNGCGRGSRCYAFLAFAPGGSRPVADVVVDLVSGRVGLAELEPGR